MNWLPITRGPLGLIAAAWVAAFLAITPPAAAVEVQKVVSPGGITAYLVEDHKNPILALAASFRGGAALDPDGKEGLSELATSLLDEGAGDLDSQAYNRAVEDIVASITFDAGRDTVSTSLRTLTEHRDEAVRLFRLALSEPRFDPDTVARVRSQMLASLRHKSEDPQSIAAKAMMKSLFPDHPYGRPVDGTVDSVADITRTDLTEWVTRRLARDNLVVGAVGDITPEELGRLLDKAFGGLPDKAAPWALPEVTPVTDGSLTVIEKPVPQSTIMVAQRGVKRGDPDWYGAYVLNYILGGGGFSSRLYQEVREERGLAYSAYSYLAPFDHGALWMGGAATANARVGETVSVVNDVWRTMHQGNVTANALADAKTYLTGSFPLRFDSSSRIARILAAMQLEDLGIDYLDKRNSFIEAVSLEDVNRLAEKLLTPDALTTIIVGRPEGLDPQAAQAAQ